MKLCYKQGTKYNLFTFSFNFCCLNQLAEIKLKPKVVFIVLIYTTYALDISVHIFIIIIAHQVSEPKIIILITLIIGQEWGGEGINLNKLRCQLRNLKYRFHKI